jgi:hypothetical protein
MPTKEPEIGNMLHLSVVTTGDKLLDAIRYYTGNWSSFGDVKAEAGDLGVVTDIALQGLGNLMHLFAVSRTAHPTAHLFHSSRRPDGTWARFENVADKAGFVDDIIKVRTGSSGGALDGILHICAQNSLGELYHATLSVDGVTWTNFVSLDDPGRAGKLDNKYRFACAGAFDQEFHVCVVKNTGKLYHARRFDTGLWVRYLDVETFAGSHGPIVEVACATYDVDLYIFTVTNDGKLWYTISNNPSSYRLFQDYGRLVGSPGKIIDLAVGSSDEKLQVVVKTDDGRLWHSLYNPSTGKFTRFADVLAQTGDPGAFITTIAAGGLYR